MGFWTARQERAADEREADGLWWAWRQACEGAGLCTQTDTASGPTVVTPRLVDIVLGPPTVLTVALLPGQLLSDVRRVALRLAPHLGAVALRITPLGQVHARIELLAADPLDGTVELVPVAPGLVLLGRDETARELVQSWADDVAHTIVQGVTRSGKSVFTYGVLAQLAADPLVTLCGCDPTGLLWRPFAGTRHAAWQVSGVADPAAHEELLLRLDRRQLRARYVLAADQLPHRQRRERGAAAPRRAPRDRRPAHHRPARHRAAVRARRGADPVPGPLPGRIPRVRRRRTARLRPGARRPDRDRGLSSCRTTRPLPACLR